MTLHRHSYTISLLEEVAEFLAPYVDIRDGSDGPLPNKAMSLKAEVEQEIERLKRAAPQDVSGTKVNQPAQAVAGLSDAKPVCERPSPAVAAQCGPNEPVAWMTPVGRLMTTSERDYWLKEWPTQAAGFTIPLYRHDATNCGGKS